MNEVLATLLLIPVMLLMPVLTLLAGSFATFTAYLLQAVVNLFYAVATLIATVAAALAFGSALKMLWLRGSVRGSRRR